MIADHAVNPPSQVERLAGVAKEWGITKDTVIPPVSSTQWVVMCDEAGIHGRSQCITAITAVRNLIKQANNNNTALEVK
jgi:hypothetical protein